MIFSGKEEKMKILEEIKENLAEGRKSPMEEIYETRNGLFLSFSELNFDKLREKPPLFTILKIKGVAPLFIIFTNGPNHFQKCLLSNDKLIFLLIFEEYLSGKFPVF